MTERTLVVGALIFDHERGNVGTVEELRDGLVKYAVRQIGTMRPHCFWTNEQEVAVLLDHLPADEDGFESPRDRLIMDLVSDAPNFHKDESGAVYWNDILTNTTYEVTVDIGSTRSV